MSHIILENISLTYPVYGANGRSLKSGLFNIATGGRLAKSHSKVMVEALHDISLELKSGDRLGIIGHNGAGKTTLLKVLAQIYEPTEGKILVKGNANCIFDIMMGMDQESTGYENIILRGLILGLSRREAKALIPDVEEFAELGEFIKMPIKTYSSGMLVRLAFGIITSFPSNILLLDEVVNVGDANFVKKAKARMQGLIHQSDILVLSSHDINIMKELCNKVLWLEHGYIRSYGKTQKVYEKYMLTLSRKSKE